MNQARKSLSERTALFLWDALERIFPKTLIFSPMYAIISPTSQPERSPRHVYDRMRSPPPFRRI